MYAFIHIPKTAGSTFRHTLRCTFSGRHCDVRAPLAKRGEHNWLTAADMRKVHRAYPRLDSIAGHRVNCFNGLEDALGEIQYLTFLRHPHSRFVSQFWNNNRHRAHECTPRDFIDFCHDPHQRNVQTRWLCGSEDPLAAIHALDRNIGFMGLTETYDESLVLFKKWLGHDGLRIEYVKRNLGPVQSDLPIESDARLQEELVQANVADEVVYRYATEVVYPRLKAAYGPGLADDVAAFRQRNRDTKEEAEPIWGRMKRNLIYKPLLHLNLA